MTLSSGNPTSYFSKPEPTLDPTLFRGRSIQPWVRTGITALLHDFLNTNYRHPDLWSHPWLAGSGVSYQWSANRQPGDLDCLVGIDFPRFRQANPEYRGLSDTEISQQINEQFRDGLQPKTADWHGYELTFYVNPTGTDIRNIHPYAAYDLKYDEWTVTPDPNAEAPHNPAWEQAAVQDRSMAAQIATRFTIALNDVKTSHNDALRRNAELRLLTAGQQGSALYDEIHTNRSQAFSATGKGYSDFHNYRWQAGKREGTIQMLRNIRDTIRQQSSPQTLYGVDLPDTATLIRRAATYRSK
jgi:hypothetical protein